MRRVLGPQYDQVFLLPPVVEDWVGPEHPARFIREVVASLDLRALGFAVRESSEGGEYFPASCLLAVWLYGYFRKVRSTRELERSCQNDLGFIWLVGLRAPDHNTLWSFYHQHRAAVGRLFKESVQMALRLELVGLVLQAVDGTKIQALCAGRISQTKEAHEQLLAKLEETIAETEQALAAAAADGSTPAPELPPALQGQQRLREKVSAAVREMEQSGRKHCHAQEPEARRMETEGSNRFGYNAQAVVDAQSQVIVAAEVFTQETDHGLLVPMAEAARENLGATVPNVADAGYAGSGTFAAAEAAELPVFTVLPERWQPRPEERFHSSQFVYDAARDCLICPAGADLPRVRTRLKEGVSYAVYRSKAACARCPLRSECTRDGNGRTIDLGPHDEALQRQRVRQAAPAVAEILRQRSRIVEPVFAQIKTQGRFRRWTVRGLANVQAQWAWLCTSWNLRVIYRGWRGVTARTTAAWAHGLRVAAPSATHQPA